MEYGRLIDALAFFIYHGLSVNANCKLKAIVERKSYCSQPTWNTKTFILE